jgi:hypothetical protein
MAEQRWWQDEAEGTWRTGGSCPRTADEIDRMETPYTTRYDFQGRDVTQGISDPTVLSAISMPAANAPADYC